MIVSTNAWNRRNFAYVMPEPKRRGLKPTYTCILTWHMLAFLIYYYFTIRQGCNAQSMGKVRLLDLSHPFDDTTIYWVTAKKLNFTVTYNGTAPGKDYWYQSDEIAAATHGGTHMDSPCHFALGRWCISDIPVERFVVPAAVIDISNDVGDDPNVHLSLDHVMKWERAHGQIPDGSLLLVRTGWSKFWPDPLTYSGTTERKADLLKFPSIKHEVAKWLVANRDIVGIGIDVMSIDPPGGEIGTHVTLLEKNIYALENVNFPEPLPPTGVKVYAMPMKLKGASGAPCRVLAELPADMTNGNANSSNSISLIWILIIAVWTLKNGRF